MRVAGCAVTGLFRNHQLGRVNIHCCRKLPNRAEPGMLKVLFKAIHRRLSDARQVGQILLTQESGEPCCSQSVAT